LLQMPVNLQKISEWLSVEKACRSRCRGYRGFTKMRRAFTLIELLVVVAIVAIIAAMFPGRPPRKAKEKALAFQCMSNLKQTSLGYVLLAADANTNLFPWQVSTNSGGTAELIEQGNAADHFRPLAPYLKNPESLFCPTDGRSRQRTNSYVGLSNTNLSYFASLDARIGTSVNPYLILAGDRHLTVGNQSVSPGLFATTNYAALGWKGGHPARGMLAFVDGHVESNPMKEITSVFQRQSIGTNRLVIP
jgi:prepilin-type N-terminal cleavage/methylation domain-containing protein/prepilin-type processing-associated H-X9-DG protein